MSRKRYFGIVAGVLAMALWAVGGQSYAVGVSDYWVSSQLSGQQRIYIGAASASLVTTPGFASGVDFGGSIGNNIELSFGIQDQFYRSLMGYVGNFNFDDFFVSLRLPISLSTFTVYPVGRIGYGFFFGDTNFTGTFGTLTGGLYYSVGIGIRSPSLFSFKLFGTTYQNLLFVEGTYDSNAGSLYDSYYGLNETGVYSTWNIYLGLCEKV